MANYDHIDSREFKILSLIVDAGAMTVIQISTLLGFSRELTLSCVKHLHTVGLVSYETYKFSDGIIGGVSPSSNGKSLARRIYSNNGKANINFVFSGGDCAYSPRIPSQRTRSSPSVAGGDLRGSSHFIRNRT